MILSVGEILLDMIGSETPSGIDFDSHAGGAPLNVAASVAKLGGKAYFVGSVGDDIPGQYLKRFVKTLPLEGFRLETIAGRNTTLAFVTLANGERDFCFYRESTADYALPSLDAEFLEKFNIVHIGSLMLSKDEGLRYALNLATKAKSNGCLVSFDVNFRKDIYASEEEAVKRSKAIMEKADIIKLSDDEIEIFGRAYFQNLVKSHHVFLTKGKKGSCYYCGEAYQEAETFEVKPIDTTGAGDAFYGAVLAQLDEKNSFDVKEMKDILKIANACGALATLGRGAIAPLASLEEAKAFMNRGGLK